MAEAHVHRETAVEYFKELVEAAVEHQRLEADEATFYYIVNLLAGYVQAGVGEEFDQPLGVKFAEALQAAGNRQRDGLRRVGDASLFLAGFFSDSLSRRLVDVDYYTTLGAYSYGTLGQSGGMLAGTYSELADKFARFVDVLSEVSGRSRLTSNTDLLRLYERWMRTRSRLAGSLLAARGIVPMALPPSRSVQ